MKKINYCKTCKMELAEYREDTDGLHADGFCDKMCKEIGTKYRGVFHSQSTHKV